MNKLYLLLSIFIFTSLSSFGKSMECEYAGSNIAYAKVQAEKALNDKDINKAKYFAYKALNAFEKSKKQLTNCGCELAGKNIEEGLRNLKLATKATSLHAAQLLLAKSLEYTQNSLDALKKHHLHNTDDFMTAQGECITEMKHDSIAGVREVRRSTNQKIAISLEKYKASLDKIVSFVTCEEAKIFARDIADHCNEELLKENLSDGKKYYNLKMKEITDDALQQIGHCAK